MAWAYCYSYCKEKNEIPSEAEFSMNEDGMQELFVWLETSYESMKKQPSRPKSDSMT